MSIVFDISYCELFNIITHMYIFDTFVKEVKNLTKKLQLLQMLLEIFFGKHFVIKRIDCGHHKW